MNHIRPWFKQAIKEFLKKNMAARVAICSFYWLTKTFNWKRHDVIFGLRVPFLAILGL
ncbi:hypothetical protein [Kushneria phyllosphaerae]|uniref:hypothetical protein n=1 Tax=Kushneria phyllosphaerae TaxID=2100822 RepID=UPI0014027FE3|nr:hypothetical protein [Kushneria phyllosphaerae]